MSRLYSYITHIREGGGRKEGEGNDDVKGFQQVVCRLCCTGLAVAETTLGRVSCSCKLEITEAHSCNHDTWAAAFLHTQAGKMPRNPELMQGSVLYHPKLTQVSVLYHPMELDRSYFFSNHVLLQLDDTHKDPTLKVSPPLEPFLSCFYLQQQKVTIDMRSWGELTSLFRTQGE